MLYSAVPYLLTEINKQLFPTNVKQTKAISNHSFILWLTISSKVKQVRLSELKNDFLFGTIVLANATIVNVNMELRNIARPNSQLC